ncbi:MAG: vanomycin resistance protein VanB [Clostridiaceae bacterium]|jgi:vancomycin resistance protein YoaR|nr:vanomycin resistance protein VanB [Clostridiaceae bacterium]
MTVARRKSLKWPLYAAILILVAVSAAFMVLARKYTGDTIRKGIIIENTDVSWLSSGDARRIVEDTLKKNYAGDRLILTYGGRKWDIRLSDIDYRFEVDRAVEKAFSIGREGNVFRKLLDSVILARNGLKLDVEVSFSREKLRSILEEIKKECDTHAKNASVTYTGGQLRYTREVPARELDVDTNLKLVENYLTKRDFSDIELIVGEKEPEITYEDVKEVNSVLSSFSTTFNRNDVNRTDNIKLACSRIDNLLVMPGEEFSMNRELGPRTHANGYKQAPIIFRNELVPGTGGGVCQVSSTLYNAVLLAGLKVTEREHHSMPLSYISPGRDATITESSIDFRFVNNMEHPVLISANVKGNKLTISILGKKRDDGTEFRLRTKTVGIYRPKPEKIVLDETLEPGQKVVERKAKNGIRVILYRDSYKNGVLQWSEKLTEDYYRPVQGITRVSSDIWHLYNAQETPAE